MDSSIKKKFKALGILNDEELESLKIEAQSKKENVERIKNICLNQIEDELVRQAIESLLRRKDPSTIVTEEEYYCCHGYGFSDTTDTRYREHWASIEHVSNIFGLEQAELERTYQIYLNKYDELISKLTS